jgi:predicted nucleic acid-binding protein
MSWLLDTCALSEKLQKRPDAAFVKWLEAQEVDDLYISIISVGEIRKGIELLPDSIKKHQLEQWFKGEFIPFFDRRIRGIGHEEAIEWGTAFARCQLSGYKPPVLDSLLAATAKINGLTLVTRNEKDFSLFDVEVINPWGKP